MINLSRRRRNADHEKSILSILLSMGRIQGCTAAPMKRKICLIRWWALWVLRRATLCKVEVKRLCAVQSRRTRD